MTIHQVIIDRFLRRDRWQAVDSHELVNLTILALTQIGLNVGTVLLAGAVLKWYAMWDSFGVPLRSIKLETWFCNYGWLCLVVPFIWVGITISKRSDPQTSEQTNYTLGMIGWLIIVIWFTVFFAGVLIPFVTKISLTQSHL